MFMNIVIGILIGLFVLMFLVTAHEFGHFIMARRNGVRVNEFGICFPPRAIAWVKGKDGKWHKIPKKDWKKPQDSLIFSLNCLPIGGFCAMDGESDADTKVGTFGAANFWQKTKILFGGVLMNWLVAFIILTVLAWTGMPVFFNNQFYFQNDTTFTSGAATIESVKENSPAEAAGFQTGDEIIRVNGKQVVISTDVIEENQSHPGEEVKYQVSRDGKLIELTATLNQADAEYLLGIQMYSNESFFRTTWSAPIVGAITTVQLTGETFRGVGDMLWNFVSGIARQFSFDDQTREEGRQSIGAAGDSVSGPVGIIGVIFPAFVESGATNIAFLAALISVSLACMNVLPIPALDGGRWFLIALYRLRGKVLTKETEERIVSYAFYILFILIIVITALDITRFFR